MLKKKITRSQARKDHAHGTYGEERGARKRPARKVGSITMKGRTGTTATDTNEPRLVDRQGKRRKVATELLKNKSTSAGPKGKLPDHTVYHDIGYLMAESLGLVSETTRKDTYGGTGPDRMAKTPFKRKSSESKYDSKKELKSDLASARRKGKSFIGKGDSADNTIIVEPGTPLTPKQKEARKKYQEKVKTDRATARLKHRAKTTGEPQTVIRRKKK